MRRAPIQTDLPRIAPAGDQALTVEFGPYISRAVNQRVRDLEHVVMLAGWREVVGMVPGYRSLLIYYDPISISFEELAQRVQTLAQGELASGKRSKRWTLPVRYGAECGADLDELAAKLKMQPDKVIRTHSAAEYMVYMIGFSPGFAYLGELPSALEVPRKTVPNPLVPANTIQIGGQQTAVSSMPMPSGWYIVGRTPVNMYEADRPRPFLLDGGDFVTFKPITSAEFIAISERVDGRDFEPTWEWAE
jgi:KipI family sensor histidine kinase inhibitor